MFYLYCSQRGDSQMEKKNLVVFSGAGMSAESGISTFRDSGGLWEQYRLEEVATPEAWQRNPALVLDFYNQRRRQVMEARPNKGHEVIAALQEHFNVEVITQNIDDLHERAGSKQVLHLHGEIMKSRSSRYSQLIYNLDHWEMKMGETCEKGTQLRPHIVWFGEMVPEMDRAILLAEQADIFITVGTSLNVYPAANLLNFVPDKAPKYLIDPGNFSLHHIPGLIHYQKTAGEGLQLLRELLLKVS